MTADELKNLNLKELDQQGAVIKPRSEKKAIVSFACRPKSVGLLGASPLLRRFLWAVFLLGIFIVLDLGLHLLAARQEAGLPLIDISPLGFVRVREFLDELVWWLGAKTGGPQHESITY